MAVTPSQAESLPDGLTHVRKSIGIWLASAVTLFAVGGLWGVQIVSFISTGIVPSGYVRTTAIVSNSYCTEEDLTFSDQIGRSYTVPYALLYLGNDLCHNDPVGSQKLVAYNPMQPSVNVKVPFQANQIAVTALLVVGILIVGNTIPKIMRRARE